MSEQVTLTDIRCSGCEKKFSVINIDSQDSMECPHCHEKYFKYGGTWHNEKCRDYFRLTAAEVAATTQELRDADYQKVGHEFFETRVNRLKDYGWKLGIHAYCHKVHKGKRGHLLRTPRNEWRNVAYFYNEFMHERVWYWDNLAITKLEAESIARRTPAPDGAQSYMSFTKRTC